MTKQTKAKLKIGIDEAGYGPILGPLCVAGFSCFADFDSDKILDSKKIHRKNNLNPLIERCHFYHPKSIEHLLQAKDSEFPNEPWFHGAGLSKEEILHYQPSNENQMAVRSLGVQQFNRLYQEGHNKAQIEIQLIGSLIESLSSATPNVDEFEFRIDRLGGRKDYAEVAESWGFTIQDATVEKEQSFYTGFFRDRPCTLSFSVKGDQSHHVIAAASCLAKLQREIFMRQFNTWWIERIPNLKPTAGYYTDGMRFLKVIENYMRNTRIDLRYLQRAA